MALIPEEHAPIPKTYKNKPLVKKYGYYNDIGELIGCVAYYGQSSTPGKSGRVLFFDYEHGEWKPEIDIRIKKLPLYRLRKLQSRPKSMRVVIVENERSALALSKLGICAVSPVEGVDFNNNKTDWSPLNGIRFVYLMPSNDDIGIRFTEDVYMQLRRLPKPPQLKIVNLPNLAENDDPLDWLQKDNPGLWEGNEPVKKFDDRESILKGPHMIHLLPNVLNELLYEADVFISDDEEDSEQNEIVWPTPRSLVNENQPVMAMTNNMLPRAMRSYLINANPEAPLDYTAVTAIIVAGSLIGSGCGICPKNLDDSWVELPNLWAALIGGPGVKKTPSMDRVLSLAERLQAEYTKQYNSKELTTQYHTIRHKAKLGEIIQKIQILATAIPEETTADRNLELKRKFIKLSKIKPVNFRRLFMTNETSVQGMTKLQAKNPRGILLIRDELAGLLAEWYGKNASDRGYYLSSWNRMGSYMEAKITRGITEADNICISLLGTIQPDKFKIYVQKAAQGDNDGLMQRFQLAVYPDAPKWTPVDSKQDEKEIERVYSIFKTLAEMDFLECGATTNTLAKRPSFHFDEEAQQIFNDWNEDLNKNKIKNEPNVLISEHLSKYPKLFASLALIFYCIELADNDELLGNVNAYAAKLAVKWCEYLETHARRIYAQLDNFDKNKAIIRLSEMIKAKEVPNPFNAKDIYGRHMTALKTREEVEAACEVLVEANWLKRQEPEKGKGRPPLDKYIINPAFM